MKLTVKRRGSSPISLEYNPPALLSSILCGAGIYLDMPCGGRKTCLKCRVTAYGGLSEPDERERALLGTELEKNMRYACMAEAVGDVVVELGGRQKDAILTDGEVSGIPEPWCGDIRWGIAVDIGTTTVAALLYNLKSGDACASAAMRNPQTVYGADVITRIGKAAAGEGESIADCIRHGISAIIDELSSQAGISRADIDAVIIAGNTAMMYLFCGFDPSDIAAAPFEAHHLFGQHFNANAFGLEGVNADIYLTPCISAYIGGDITAAVLAGEIHTAQAPVLLVDIGTNGEMVINTGDGRLVGCSTAAGPAFEGAGIAMGMRAADGAVAHVELRGGEIVCEVIGEGKAGGICGSGIIDAIAVMLDAGIIDETGYLLEEGHEFEKYICSYNGGTAFRLPGTEVAVTQGDIRAVQLGKSAICAGMQALLEKTGLCAGEISELVIAGGFGTFLNIRSAVRIGLIPPEFEKKARSCGNAALRGASMLLLFGKYIPVAEKLAREITALELSSDPFFTEKYIEGMMFRMD